MFDSWRGFTASTLPRDWHQKLTEQARLVRGDILKMTTLAGSGHPGGSMSSTEIFLTLYTMARVDPKNPYRDDRDRIIVSHGHTSPGVYASLAAVGFFDVNEAVAGFRLAGSPFEGHVEQSVPGVEWDTGNLGQGLAAGIGKAIYARLAGKDFHTYVVMGDGEQQKGQISESRRIAVKYRLNTLTVIVDYNRLQISGHIEDVMPQNIADDWKADGWQVVEIHGHDLNQIYEALHRAARREGPPTMILARTVMGKGVSFMENDHNFHGAAIKRDKLDAALAELGRIENNIEQLADKRNKMNHSKLIRRPDNFPEVLTGEPIVYSAEVSTDNRSAFGKALLSVAEANMGRDSFCMGVFDCDLASSVKTNLFADKYSGSFFQFGISEHSTATVAGSLSAEKAIAVWADFGVFAVAETYNQARLNDINHTNLKLFCTHCGVDVGEDGKTHQCIDYFGLLNSTFGWKVITPADPNQTDHIVRHVLSHPGNFAVVMGRSKTPVITTEDGRPYFGVGYEYRYGRLETIREGEKLALVTAGNMLGSAMKAWSILAKQNINITLVSVSDWSDFHLDDLKTLAAYERLVVLEDHNVKTGLGVALGAALADAGYAVRMTKMGVGDYASSGTPDQLYRMLGLDSESVAAKVTGLID